VLCARPLQRRLVPGIAASRPSSWMTGGVGWPTGGRGSAV